jgi:hypothetical protein
MKINSASPALAAAFLLSGLFMQPALAHPGGGGGGHSGGSGHSFAGHAGGSHVATQHYAARGFAGARGTSFGGGFRAPVAHWSGPAAGVGRGEGGAGFAGHAAFGGRTFGPGGFARGARWGGGYWGGRFWPGVRYGVGFAWFLPVLPLYYSTFWWGNVPYYYYNDAYYTWNPSADGYVATDPPPAASAAPSDGGAGPNADVAPQSGPGPTQGPISPGAMTDNVYAYPANGQTDDQQAADRMQCDQWAGQQTGGSGGANGSPEFRRAVIACFQGRGYSAQ